MELQQILEMLAEMKIEMKADREEMLAKMDAHHTRTEANYEDMMAKLDAHQERIKASVNAWRKEMKANRGATEANPDEMKSVMVHEEVPKEEAAVKSLEALKKSRGYRYLAVGRCGEPQEWTQGKDGSRRELAAERRPAVQEWHGARDTSSGRIRPGTKLPEEPGKDGRSRGGNGRARKAALELEAETSSIRYVLEATGYPTRSTVRLSYWSS
jgi:hypothetical protein